MEEVLKEEVLTINIPTSHEEVSFKKFYQTQENLLEFYKSAKAPIDELIWQAKDLAVLSDIDYSKIVMMPIDDIRRFTAQIQWLYNKAIDFTPFTAQDDVNQTAPAIHYKNCVFNLYGFSDKTPYLAELDMKKNEMTVQRKEYLLKKKKDEVESNDDMIMLLDINLKELKLMMLRLSIVLRKSDDVYNVDFSNNLQKRALFLEDLSIATVYACDAFFLQREILFTTNSLSYSLLQLEVANTIQNGLNSLQNMVDSDQQSDLPAKQVVQ